MACFLREKDPVHRNNRINTEAAIAAGLSRAKRKTMSRLFGNIKIADRLPFRHSGASFSFRSSLSTSYHRVRKLRSISLVHQLDTSPVLAAGSMGPGTCLSGCFLQTLSHTHACTHALTHARKLHGKFVEATGPPLMWLWLWDCWRWQHLSLSSWNPCTGQGDKFVKVLCQKREAVVIDINSCLRLKGYAQNFSSIIALVGQVGWFEFYTWLLDDERWFPQAVDHNQHLKQENRLRVSYFVLCNC